MKITVTEDVFLDGKFQENRPVQDALVFDGTNQFFTNELGEVKLPDNFEQIKIVAVGFDDVDLKRNEIPEKIILNRLSGELQTVEVTATKKKPRYSWLILLLLAIYLYKQ